MQGKRYDNHVLISESKATTKLGQGAGVQYNNRIDVTTIKTIKYVCKQIKCSLFI